MKVAKVKAAFLYNFSKFVHWPDGAFAADDSPVVIGIFGEDPFRDVLDNAVKGKTIGRRPFTIIRTSADARDWRSVVRTCHILYVADTESSRIGPLLESLANIPVLLVGEGEPFARSWGSIGFALEEGRVVLHINRRAAENAGLKLGADLLGIARLVDPEAGARRNGK